MANLEGKVAVVMGAAGRGNMAQSIARRLAADGARLVLAGRDPEPLAELAEELGGVACRIVTAPRSIVEGGDYLCWVLASGCSLCCSSLRLVISGCSDN